MAILKDMVLPQNSIIKINKENKIMTEIEKMLREGISAETIINQLNDAQNKLKEEKKRKDNIANYRKTVTNALYDYLAALGFTSEDEKDEIIKVITDSLKETEEFAEKINAATVSKGYQTKVKLASKKSDDEILLNFLKSLK